MNKPSEVGKKETCPNCLSGLQMGKLPEQLKNCPMCEGEGYVFPKILITGPPMSESIEVTLTERRAEFVYNAARLAAIAAKAPIVPVPWSEREQDFRDQFLKVIERQCGEQRSSSPQELHGSWMQSYIDMGWRHGEKYDRENRIHPDLAPYAQLGQLERDKDAVFVALCEIARLWIREAADEEEKR